MARVAKPVITDFSVETIRKFALSNTAFVKAARIRRAELQSQINEIDSLLGEAGVKETATPAKRKVRQHKAVKRGRPAKAKKAGSALVKPASGTGRRGRPPKGKTSLKDGVFTIIRNNGGRIEVNEIINRLKKLEFDVSAKTIGVMIQHALRALAVEGVISRSKRGIASITAKGARAVAAPPPEPTPTPAPPTEEPDWEAPEPDEPHQRPEVLPGPRNTLL